jgi:hypothetical protein
MRLLSVAVVIFLGVGHVAAEPAQIKWSDLVDKTVQSFEDPFRDLSYEQLAALRKYAIAQERLASDEVTDKERSELELRFTDSKAALAADGIDPDWLISQRWIVADRRTKAVTAGNVSLDGTEVILAGYAIPAPPEEDGDRVAYLVPERGMCSHTPPPPPNQLVRLLLNGDWSPSMMHEPVVATGRLSIDPTKRQVLFVDGFMSLEATFSLDVSNARTFDNPQSASPTTNEWAAGLAKKFWRGGKPGVEKQ